MDAVEFIKEYQRMCAKESCHNCPAFQNVAFGDCDLDTKDPEGLVNIVQQWSQPHPQKTMMQDFFEKFPNAPKDEKEGGVPKLVCPKQLGYTDIKEDCIELFDCDCLKCWNRPLED